MTDRRPFLAAVWAAPDDDLPRLVFADYLDDRGESDAATFLRLLCAARTCPPDLGRLRPLVADLRRAMVKAGPRFVEEACPVPPAVVVGPWVDVDHDANTRVLRYIRQRRRARVGLEPDEVFHVRPDQEARWPSQWVVDRLWELKEVLSPAAACAVNGVPALVDVWSGVVMAVAAGDMGYAVRRPLSLNQPATPLFLVPLPEDLAGVRRRVEIALGDGWAFGLGSVSEEGCLRQAATEFDPANG